ncbi:hypothetical protein CRENBAI_025473 [Crenichthys baileyi]|uniref:Transposase Tc1-like domain-containing protein n=1 Tax=Crenichthys baileyi TaxID=28760 RepID=A0AAV9SG62_9TELE
MGAIGCQAASAACQEQDTEIMKNKQLFCMCAETLHMSAAIIAAEVEGVVGHPVSAQTIHHPLHQIGRHRFCPRRKPLLKMMHKKTCK